MQDFEEFTVMWCGFDGSCWRVALNRIGEVSSVRSSPLPASTCCIGVIVVLEDAAMFLRSMNEGI